MTKNTISNRNRNLSEYLANTQAQSASTPPTGQAGLNTKTTTDPAQLAQELASNSSWADRYVPGTPSETVMTPTESSVAGDASTVGNTDYQTPDEAPPTYELATSESDPRSSSASQYGGPGVNVSSFPRPQPQFHTPPLATFPADIGPDQVQPFPQSQQPIALATRPRLPGRSYSRHETSQSINGTFTLHDSLDLSTTSGSINIKIDVRPGSEPATLRLKSQSGSIQVEDMGCNIANSCRSSSSSSLRRQSCGGSGGGGFWGLLFGGGRQAPPVPVSDDPRKLAGQGRVGEVPSQEVVEEKQYARVIHTTIESSSGSANVHLLLTAGSQTRVKTSSGSIYLRMVSADSNASAFRPPLSKLEQEDFKLMASRTTDLTSLVSTMSGSGSQSIHVNTSFGDTSNGAIVSAIKASHHSLQSASVSTYYPKEWNGLVHASIGGSGSVSVRGHGLEYDKRGSKETYAWRGVDGEPKDWNKAVQIRCDGSGSVSFNC